MRENDFFTFNGSIKPISGRNNYILAIENISERSLLIKSINVFWSGGNTPNQFKREMFFSYSVSDHSVEEGMFETYPLEGIGLNDEDLDGLSAYEWNGSGYGLGSSDLGISNRIYPLSAGHSKLKLYISIKPGETLLLGGESQIDGEASVCIKGIINESD